ncbi:MAG: hypothetical protein Q9190_004445 [Brigantiaea leucoxantha]
MSFHQNLNSSPIDQSGAPEVIRHVEEKEHIAAHEEKEHFAVHEEKEAGHPGHLAQGYRYTAQYPQANPEKETILAKKKLLWIAIVSLLLVGALIGGLVGGLKSRKDNSSSKEPSTSSADSPTPSLNATSVSFSPTSTSTASQQSASSQLNSSLASIAWANGDGHQYRRLYYQDVNGTIKETAWNSSESSWYASNENLGHATTKSPIAATVAGNTTWPFQINLYYLAPDGHLVEMLSNDGTTWREGATSSAGIIPAPNSNLAAIWTQSDQGSCGECGGPQILLIAFQESNNRIIVANTSDTTPVLATLDANPLTGTGLAFQQVWHSKGSPGLRIYYQDDAEDLCTIDWETEVGAEALDSAWSWTLHEDAPINAISRGAQIASFSWGTNATTGDPVLQRTLTSGPQGVSSFGLGGGREPDRWQAEHPAVMENIQAYSSLAANADRHVYALETGIVQEFVLSSDGTTWNQIGNVTLVG